MRIVRAARHFVLAACIALSGALPGAGADLKVVTWNLEWFPGKTPSPTPAAAEAHFNAVRAELQKLDPDIFIAQEVVDAAAFERLVSSVSNLHLHVISNFQEGGNRKIQQVAVASKLPAYSAWFEPWKATTVAPPRGFSFSAIQLGSNRLLGVYSVHLKSNRTGKDGDLAPVIAMREESIRQFTSHVHDVAARFTNEVLVGVLVAGDFNTNRENEGLKAEHTLDLLEAAGYRSVWQGVAATNRATWRGSDQFPACTFDYLYGYGIEVGAGAVFEVPETTGDHRPLVSNIRL